MGGHGHGGHFRGGGFRGGGGFVYPLYDFYPPDPGPDIIILSEQAIDATDNATSSNKRAEQRSPVHGEPRFHAPPPHGRARPHPAASGHGTQAQRSVYGPRGGRVHPPHGHGGHALREPNAALHGDTTAAVGNAGEFEPNFGLDLDFGQTGMQAFSGVNNTLSETNSGVDPFGLAQFGDDAQESDVEYGSANPFADLSVPNDEDLASFHPWGTFTEMDVEDDFDPIVHSQRSGTLRTTEAWAENPTYIGFEPDMFSGFGRAPIIGYGKPRG
jgi:hypothetical protein